MAGPSAGIISAARLWVSVPVGFVWSAAADRLGAHRALLVATMAASLGARLALNWGTTFPVLLVRRRAARERKGTPQRAPGAPFRPCPPSRPTPAP
jgi:hypothetical protein